MSRHPRSAEGHQEEERGVEDGRNAITPFQNVICTMPTDVRQPGMQYHFQVIHVNNKPCEAYVEHSEAVRQFAPVTYDSHPKLRRSSVDLIYGRRAAEDDVVRKGDMAIMCRPHEIRDAEREYMRRSNELRGKNNDLYNKDAAARGKPYLFKNNVSRVPEPA